MATFQQNQESNREMAAILANIANPSNGLSLLSNDNIFNNQTDGYEMVIRPRSLDESAARVDAAAKRLEESIKAVRRSFSRMGISIDDLIEQTKG
jgi:hypothetical protein